MPIYHSMSDEYVEAEQARKEAVRKEAQDFVDAQDPIHRPVTGGLYRGRKSGGHLTKGDIIMVVSKGHHVSNTWLDGFGEPHPTELPEWQRLHLLTPQEKVWIVKIGEAEWFRWFERVIL